VIAIGSNKRASQLRDALLHVLSPDGKCAKCRKRFGATSLEVDHVDGREWSARELYFRDRVKRYWTEFLEGVRLRALCRSCNAIDGNHRRWSREAKAA
jgi:hypothetical protein